VTTAPDPVGGASGGAVHGADGRARCPWTGTDPLYLGYHDDEWGTPLHGDRALFERLVLEGFQAGLAWITVLRKREAFRAAFADFEPERVAAFGSSDVEQLMADTGIVRNRAKIDAAVANARAALQVPGGLSELLWSFAPEQLPPVPVTTADVPAVTAESTAMAKELKRRGFRFVGPTTAYALMQATGMVDDHLRGCWRREAGAKPG
jgi:DNA-3-methyladenine glycosylase I